MRTILFSFLLFLSLSVFTSCEDEINHQTVLSPISYKTGDLRIDLTGSVTDTILLEWTPSKAEDASIVFYRVEFSSSKDGFDAPEYAVIPSTLGTDPFLKVTDYSLNKIAEEIGIKQLSAGNIYWRVVSSNGINRLDPEGVRTIEVTRPDGFVSTPNSLYIAGSATSTGENVSSAMGIRKENDSISVFEGLLELESGEFYFFNTKTGKSRRFSISGDAVVEDGKTECTLSGTYHVKIDFATAQAEFNLITSVELVVVKLNTPEVVVASLDYKGNFTWESTFLAVLPNQSNIPAGSQYKFKLTGIDGINGSEKSLYWGSPNASSSPPNTGVLPDNYYYVVRDLVNDPNPKYYFRFPTTIPGKEVKTTLYMRSDLLNYYHTCTILN